MLIFAGKDGDIDSEPEKIFKAESYEEIFDYIKTLNHLSDLYPDEGDITYLYHEDSYFPFEFTQNDNLTLRLEFVKKSGSLPP